MRMSVSVPPVIRILLDEDVDLSDHRAFRQRLLGELQRQARWSASNYRYANALRSPAPASFTASGAANPFSRNGCRSPACRQRAALHFARTLCLYGETVTIADHFTARLLRDETFSDDHIRQFASDVTVLRTLGPLINNGIVRFTSGINAFCPGCATLHFERLVEAVQLILDNAQDDFCFEMDRSWLFLKSRNLYDPPLAFAWDVRRLRWNELTNDQRRLLEAQLLAQHVLDAVGETMLDAYSASVLQASLVAASRFDAWAVRALDGAGTPVDELPAWEESRQVSLPWIGALSCSDVVLLRERASEALPQFRALMARVLVMDDQSKQNLAVTELREGAIALGAELRALSRRDREFRSVIGTLGVTAAIYGFASGFITPAVALGSLLSLYGVVHASTSSATHEFDELIKRPAYILLKAREFHREGG